VSKQILIILPPIHIKCPWFSLNLIKFKLNWWHLLWIARREFLHVRVIIMWAQFFYRWTNGWHETASVGLKILCYDGLKLKLHAYAFHVSILLYAVYIPDHILSCWLGTCSIDSSSLYVCIPACYAANYQSTWLHEAICRSIWRPDAGPFVRLTQRMLATRLWSEVKMIFSVI
jgi:hypothetical protein